MMWEYRVMGWLADWCRIYLYTTKILVVITFTCAKGAL